MSLFLFAPGILISPILMLLLGFFSLFHRPGYSGDVQEVNSEHPAYVNGIYMMISLS